MKKPQKKALRLRRRKENEAGRLLNAHYRRHVSMALVPLPATVIHATLVEPPKPDPIVVLVRMAMKFFR